MATNKKRISGGYANKRVGELALSAAKAFYAKKENRDEYCEWHLKTYGVPYEWDERAVKILEGGAT